ncbi:MAG: hypothetical protein H6Q69_315 [Firmicutes bacterium]|nr:hypothetical protein [Bacillota bacterium]
MLLEAWIQYGFIFVSITALIIKWRGMSKYIPAAFFMHAYAEHLCHLAMNGFGFWNYPYRIVPSVEMSIPANDIVLPILVMFWLRYIPKNRKGKILWVISWSVALTLPEYFAERYTELIKYHNGYDWYYTLLLWLITWPIIYGFHKWFWNFYHKENHVMKRS